MVNDFFVSTLIILPNVKASFVDLLNMITELLGICTLCIVWCSAYPYILMIY